MNCSNCEGVVPDALDVLTVTRGKIGTPVAVLCKQCENGVLTMKIVLSRNTEKQEFKFDGFLPVSCVK